MHLCLCKIVDKLGQLLSSLYRDGIVVTSAYSLNATMSLETSQTQSGTLLQELLLSSIDVTTLLYSEANVHSRTDILGRYNLVHVRVSVQRVVDGLGLGCRPGFLASYTIGIGLQ